MANTTHPPFAPISAMSAAYKGVREYHVQRQ